MYIQLLYIIFVPKMKDSSNTYCSCLFYSANALARAITKMAEEAFAVTGLAPSYAFLLMTVNMRPGIQPKELSAFMQLAPSTVTRLLEKMEYRKLVKREPLGKAIAVYSTPEGMALQDALVAAWNSLYQRYAGLLGESPARALTAQVYEAYEKLQAG